MFNILFYILVHTHVVITCSHLLSLFPTGNGVVIHIPQFFDELAELEAKGAPLSQAFSFFFPLVYEQRLACKYYQITIIFHLIITY